MRDVLQAIAARAARDPGRAAVSDRSGVLSYGALAAEIGGWAKLLSDSPPVVGLLMPRDRSHVVADLALSALGRTIVPLPEFFSPDQWGHIIGDAGIGAIVTSPACGERLRPLGIPLLAFEGAPGAALPVPRASRRVIYTSGTTGTPKGVVLAEQSLSASLAGLEKASGANETDIHLSVLPFALLLEQLAGILLPLKVGARLHIAASPGEQLSDAMRVGATTSVLVPSLLSEWVAQIADGRARVPASLRFVAVGGAPVPDALASQAWSLGLPVYEGYGLSECCSVVSVNRPGARRSGTAGHPLEGVEVGIEDGEIVVRGPTVMQGYLGGAAVGGVWRTGDSGRLDADGRLVVLGRRDDLIVTPEGRNIHPEWIEALLAADRRIRACALIGGSDGLVAAILPGTTCSPMDEDDWTALVRSLTSTAPAYARPVAIRLITPAEAGAKGLFTMDGRPRRHRIAAHVEGTNVRFYDHLVAATGAARTAFLSIPLIGQALDEGVDAALYLAFLNSAYHHVRHTVPLLKRALEACGPDDAVLAEGLRHYIQEETGHEEWVLEDIEALGGDAAATRHARGPLPVRTMVTKAYDGIAEEGPCALLGMVHVLEGMSIALAARAAAKVRSRLAGTVVGGFRYLTSHAALDKGHVDEFASLLDAIDSPARRRTVIGAAKKFYRLYGAIFQELSHRGVLSHAS